MALITVVAISKKKLFVGAGSYEIDGVANTTAANYDLSTWISTLITQMGGGTVNYTDVEFNNFLFPLSFKVLDQDFADLLGLTKDQLYPASVEFESTSWGYTKLVLQNAENPYPEGNSIIEIFEETGVDFNNDNVILRSLPPISSYDKDNDRDGYTVQVKKFPALRKNDVKTFFHENGNGLSETMNIFGLDFKFPDTLDFNLDLSLYTSIKDQHANKNLKQFTIGFIEKAIIEEV